MRTRSIGLKAVAAVVAFVWIGPVSQAAGAVNRRVQRDEAVREGRRLVGEGKWAEALAAYGPWAKQMESELLARIARARQAADAGKLIRLHEVYLRYYPFGYAYWHSDWRKWGKTACEYADLLEKAGKGHRDADESIRQTIAAVSTYRKLMAVHQQYKEAEVLPLVDAIVGKYPKSVFCAAAVLTLANVRARSDGGKAVAVCEKYLALMDKGGASERSRIVVLFVMGEACSNYGRRADRLRKGVATYLDIVQRTQLEHEKRVCLLNAAKAALKIRKGEAAGEARALFRRFLDRYPNACETQEARRGLVQTHLAQGKIAEATQAMRKLEKASPKGTDFSQPLFDISRAHFGKTAYDKVLAILREIVRRYPNSPASSLAWIGMGEACEKLGREAKMVEAYRKAAAKPAVGTQTNIMDASNTHNRAHQWLGKYYMKKENWAESLKWWRAWKPGSWCGTCRGSMVSRRAYAIAVCLTKTGKVDEARKELEKIVFGKAFSCGSDVAVLLVDIHRDRGQLDALAARLQKKLETKNHNGGPKIAWEYVEMIRMAAKGDVAGLWKRLDGLPYFEGKMPWRPAMAADLLVSIPEKATPHALATAGGKGREARWACVLLGRMKAPQTLATVTRKMRGEDNYGCLRDYCYALALLATPEAYARLKDDAANGKGNHKAAAAKMLERYPKPGDAEKALSQ